MMPKPNTCPDCYFHMDCKLTAPASGSRYCDYHDMLRDRMKLVDMIITAEKVIEENKSKIQEVKITAEMLSQKMQRYKEVVFVAA